MKRGGSPVSQWSLCGVHIGIVARSFLGHSPHHRARCILPATWRRSVEMDFLWITLADPEPATNGQLIYSQGLIGAVREAGARLCVVGLARTEKPDRPADQPDLMWRLGEEQRAPRWRRALRTIPEGAQRGLSPSMDRALAGALAERAWDA